MKIFPLPLFFPLLALAVVILAGCATDEHAEKKPSPRSRGVSTTPWNKPQSWEHSGPGGMPGMGF